MESPRTIANKRGKKVAEIVNRRQDGASAPEALDAPSEVVTPEAAPAET
jgi:small subunit ribosomal protein S5